MLDIICPKFKNVVKILLTHTYLKCFSFTNSFSEILPLPLSVTVLWRCMWSHVFQIFRTESKDFANYSPSITFCSQLEQVTLSTFSVIKLCCVYRNQSTPLVVADVARCAHLHKELGAHASAQSRGVFLTLPTNSARSYLRLYFFRSCI